MELSSSGCDSGLGGHLTKGQPPVACLCGRLNGPASLRQGREVTSVNQDPVQQAFEWSRCLRCLLVPMRKFVTTQTPSPGDIRNSYSFARGLEMKLEEKGGSRHSECRQPTEEGHQGAKDIQYRIRAKNVDLGVKD